jgi:hypothetical protein
MAPKYRAPLVRFLTLVPHLGAVLILLLVPR